MLPSNLQNETTIEKKKFWKSVLQNEALTYSAASAKRTEDTQSLALTFVDSIRYLESQVLMHHYHGWEWDWLPSLLSAWFHRDQPDPPSSAPGIITSLQGCHVVKMPVQMVGNPSQDALHLTHFLRRHPNCKCVSFETPDCSWRYRLAVKGRIKITPHVIINSPFQTPCGQDMESLRLQNENFNAVGSARQCCSNFVLKTPKGSGILQIRGIMVGLPGALFEWAHRPRPLLSIIMAPSWSRSFLFT